MEYSVIDPSTYGVTIVSAQPLPSSVHRRNEQGGEKPPQHSREQAKPASNQTASSPTSDRLYSIGSEIERSSNNARDARSSPQIMVPNPVPTAQSPIRPSASRQKRSRKTAASKAEARRKRRRQNIAREMGREDDSIGTDEEREYWNGVRQHLIAEEARRQALSPEERRRENTRKEAQALRDHLKPRFEPYWRSMETLSHYPIFVLQDAPPSNNGATCQLGSCPDRILPGDYRIAVTPGRQNYYGNPDYYHVKCFEELVDLSSPHYLARFESDRTKYIPDYGAQCILEEYLRRWRVRIGSLDDNSRPASDLASNPTDSEGDPSDIILGDRTITKQSDDSSQEAAIAPGQAMTNQQAEIVEEDEWRRADDIWEKRREQTTRRFQADRALFNIQNTPLKDDDNAVEWNITSYLPLEEDPEYDERHTLSEALIEWDIDLWLGTEDVDRLDEKGLRAREELGEETIKKIKRYAVVHMPTYPGLFFS
ncbi:hypothetical protein BDV26DRAFT_288226 [Aspergillus bertholletiae]|uniref:Uncharacterized protein n=1 Tax=Aspergillus bertholletiae TaxID=1226010 RepID=A0A5N7BLJ1_9EURO|nr:hypothetical protein BDV26DRAFT_288226 [Aspergillus bertholletiae]